MFSLVINLGELDLFVRKPPLRVSSSSSQAVAVPGPGQGSLIVKQWTGILHHHHGHHHVRTSQIFVITKKTVIKLS